MLPGCLNYDSIMGEEFLLKFVKEKNSYQKHRFNAISKEEIKYD